MQSKKINLKSAIIKAVCLFLCFSFLAISQGGFEVKGATQTKIYKKTTTKNGAIKAEGYDYSLPVPLNVTQQDLYMNSAVFLGDSRTVDLFIYSSLGKTGAKAYCDVGLNVSSVFSKRFINQSGAQLTALEAIKKNKKSISKAYLMFGINELGYNVDEFIKLYKKLIDEIRKIKPSTIIYVQSILPVSKSKDNSDKLHNNQNIRIFNEEIRKMCELKKVFYIDAYNVTANGEGYLPEFVAYDGVHFKNVYCEKWFEYLKKHTVIIKKEKVK